MDYDDYLADEIEPLCDCPKCGRAYDDIDFDYQSCTKCGWDAESGDYNNKIKREPNEDDYMNGDANILTGSWY